MNDAQPSVKEGRTAPAIPLPEIERRLRAIAAQGLELPVARVMHAITASSSEFDLFAGRKSSRLIIHDFEWDLEVIYSRLRQIRGPAVVAFSIFSDRLRDLAAVDVELTDTIGFAAALHDETRWEAEYGDAGRRHPIRHKGKVYETYGAFLEALGPNPDPILAASRDPEDPGPRRRRSLSFCPWGSGSIYVITQTSTGAEYVGQTSQSVQKRWRSHRRAALSGRGVTPLHQAIRSAGVEDFRLSFLESGITQLCHLPLLEKRTIAERGSLYPEGLNRNAGSDGRGDEEEH